MKINMEVTCGEKFSFFPWLKKKFGGGGHGVPPNEKICLLTQKHIPKTIKRKVNTKYLGFIWFKMVK